MVYQNYGMQKKQNSTNYLSTNRLKYKYFQPTHTKISFDALFVAKNVFEMTTKNMNYKYKKT